MIMSEESHECGKCSNIDGEALCESKIKIIAWETVTYYHSHYIHSGHFTQRFFILGIRQHTSYDSTD